MFLLFIFYLHFRTKFVIVHTLHHKRNLWSPSFSYNILLLCWNRFPPSTIFMRKLHSLGYLSRDYGRADDHRVWTSFFFWSKECGLLSFFWSSELLPREITHPQAKNKSFQKTKKE